MLQGCIRKIVDVFRKFIAATMWMRMFPAFCLPCKFPSSFISYYVNYSEPHPATEEYQVPITIIILMNRLAGQLEGNIWKWNGGGIVTSLFDQWDFFPWPWYKCIYL
jgi:hypothetical protein